MTIWWQRIGKYFRKRWISIIFSLESTILPLKLPNIKHQSNPKTRQRVRQVQKKTHGILFTGWIMDDDGPLPGA